MKIRTKAEIFALQETRIRELAEAIVSQLHLNDFIEMEIDSIYDNFSEEACVKTSNMKMIIAYPCVRKGKLQYRWIKCKYKDKDDRTIAEYTIIEGSLKMQQYGCRVGEINITSQKDLLKLAKKAPQIFALSNKKKKIDPVELVPKIQEILGVNLKEIDEFIIGRQIFNMKKGIIVGIGEKTEEYSDWYSLEKGEFEYVDKRYKIKCKEDGTIEMTVEGPYDELKNVTIKALKAFAMKKKEELMEKMNEIKL